MVQVVVVKPADHVGQGCPQINIHHEYRDIFGDSIAVPVYGEIKIAAGEHVWAYELGLKTLQVLVLTPEIDHRPAHAYSAHKYINHKGEYNNYASIDIFDDAAAFQGPGTGPVDGSIWLDFIALGE
jgi:hypothetical protein